MVDWSSLRRQYLGEDGESRLPPDIDLPVLPTALTEFFRRADEPDVTFRELGEIVSTDAGLTCELLKYVNSAAVGVRAKVQTPEQAIKVLGIRSAKLVLVSCGVRRATAARKSKWINFHNFWNTNLERALFARQVATRLRADADLAYAGGLLQDYLLPVLTDELLDQYVQFAEQGRERRQTLVEFERERFGWDHAEAGARLMVEWGFPDDLVCCVLLHHTGLDLLDDPQLGETAAAAVAVAGLMPDSLSQVPHGLQRLVDLSARWPEFDLLQAARAVEEQLKQLGGATGNYISFFHRCQQVVQRK